MRGVGLAVVLLAGVAFGPLSGPARAEDNVSVNLDALGAEPAKAPPPKKPAKPLLKPAPAASAEPIQYRPMEPVPDPAPMALTPAKPKPKPKPPQEPPPAPAGQTAVLPQQEPVQPIAEPVSAAPVEGGAPAVATPAAVAKPKPKPKAAPAPAAPGEIDFIARSRAQTPQAPQVPAPVAVEAQPLSPAIAPPKSLDAVSAPAPAILKSDMPVEEKPAQALTAVPEPPPAPPPPPAAVAKPPKPKQAPQTVVVDDGALDSVAQTPPAKPEGTPLTATLPNGPLFVPKNTDVLPQPVEAPPQAAPVEGASQPLTAPPTMPEAPQAIPAPAPAPEAAIPQSVQQTVAAVAPRDDAGANAQTRSAALEGQAVAAEILFAPGQATLAPTAQEALDALIEPLKSNNLRVQLAAYSGRPGNSSSDARRLSLRRALAVRDYLAARGVPKSMVNLVAFGGALSGPAERVDLMVRTEQLTRLSGG
jgi:outer membrane protein OmpA-like peptidoglycan-associated protein